MVVPVVNADFSRSFGLGSLSFPVSDHLESRLILFDPRVDDEVFRRLDNFMSSYQLFDRPGSSGNVALPVNIFFFEEFFRHVVSLGDFDQVAYVSQDPGKVFSRGGLSYRFGDNGRFMRVNDEVGNPVAEIPRLVMLRRRGEEYVLIGHPLGRNARRFSDVKKRFAVENLLGSSFSGLYYLRTYSFDGFGDAVVHPYNRDGVVSSSWLEQHLEVDDSRLALVFPFTNEEMSYLGDQSLQRIGKKRKKKR